MLAEVGDALDEAAADDTVRTVALRGRNGTFCRGLDLADSITADAGGAVPGSPEPYVELLRKIVHSPRVVVAVIEGQATAGGLGIVAASDFAVATAASRFHLPEALFGLVPACAGLYLWRRVPLQRLLRLSLLAENIDSAQALACGLIDEVSEQPEEALRRVAQRASRLRTAAIGRVKQFVHALGPIPEREAFAMAETARGMRDPETVELISQFVLQRRFPWE
jgi:polyketide biosynthesis enoyl-CoA hydratase PksH